MCGSDEPHLYSAKSVTYHNEQVRANEVQRVIMWNMKVTLDQRYQSVS